MCNGRTLHWALVSGWKWTKLPASSFKSPVESQLALRLTLLLSNTFPQTHLLNLLFSSVFSDRILTRLHFCSSSASDQSLKVEYTSQVSSCSTVKSVTTQLPPFYSAPWPKHNCTKQGRIFSTSLKDLCHVSLRVLVAEAKNQWPFYQDVTLILIYTLGLHPIPSAASV